MDIKYEIRHVHTKWIACKNGVIIGTGRTRDEAQNLIDEDKSKRSQFRLIWKSKSAPEDLCQFDVEAKDEIQAKIKLQQLYMDDLSEVVSIKRI